eukprot:TRINITY_DN2732_c0_g1_i5.p1 TRINITY_DN2732_c0_g1~~TRINITY_DN2732_c0_g1_i5.p1  ORF type:complete len:130 (+),score=43.79 TRINITY_DN2732_c0_g1_i5:71-460(+)
MIVFCFSSYFASSCYLYFFFFFFFNDTATPEIYTLHIVGSVRCVQETEPCMSKYKQYTVKPVSYTHLTLPTICSVQISVVAVSLKKKKKKKYRQHEEAKQEEKQKTIITAPILRRQRQQSQQTRQNRKQ